MADSVTIKMQVNKYKTSQLWFTPIAHRFSLPLSSPDGRTIANFT
jgi:hypothetical protein